MGRFSERHERQLEVNPSQPYTLWAARRPDGCHVVFVDGGDAVLMLDVGNADRLHDPENYAAWEKLVLSQLDRYRNGEKEPDFVVPAWLRDEEYTG